MCTRYGVQCAAEAATMTLALRTRLGPYEVLGLIGARGLAQP